MTDPDIPVDIRVDLDNPTTDPVILAMPAGWWSDGQGMLDMRGATIAEALVELREHGVSGGELYADIPRR